jgi:pimeloyl-ACP methyl ester carboxylesterase
VPLDDQTFMHFVTERLMDPVGAAAIPEMVFQVRDKKYTIIAEDLGGEEPAPGEPPEPNYDGVYNTVICADEAPFTTAAKIAAARDALPADFRPYFVEGRLEMCGDWKIPAAPASANEPVTGEVPVLFLSGEIDPVTPPSWSQDAARRLAHASWVLLRGLSHGTMGEPCGRAIIEEFLAAPGSKPAATCAATLPPLKFDVRR